jgi:hypothetical protein
MSGSFMRRSKRGNLSEDASSQVLIAAVRLCPRCRLPLLGHEYRLVAATVLRHDHLDRFRELLSSIKDHQWLRMLSFQDWEGNQPNAEVYGIKCPNGSLSLVLISAPFALEEPYVLMHQELVDEDMETLEKGIPASDTWHSF